jgi:membrane fusion protein, multidrug efflux system
MAEADLPRYEMASALDGGSNDVAPLSGLSRWKKLIFYLCVPILIVGGLLLYRYLTADVISTDNAYVKQGIVAISSDVTGQIVDVRVSENQQVKAGDLLFTIDPEPYRVALAQADAQIANAQVSTQELQSDYSSKSVDIAKARSDIGFAEKEYARQRELAGDGFTTKVQLEAAQHEVETARAQLATAQAEMSKARSALVTGGAGRGVDPRLALAQAVRRKAMLDLARTQVRAPESGRVSQTNRLHVGQMMLTGMSALSIVMNDKSWVEANFKEAELSRIHVGQRAVLRFDAYPDMELEGHVASIGGGTGSEFSVLPAQNATGNWVKVSQRVPVRIAIDEKPSRLLIAGLSTHVTIQADK